MRKVEGIVSWVVYRMAIQKSQTGGVAICEQSEWDQMQLAQSCSHTLIREHIASEVEAERLARSQPGVTPAPKIRLKARS